MLTYLGMFAISLTFLKIGYSVTNLSSKKNKLVFKYLFIIMSIMLPCIMASQRNIMIGSDTKGYIYKLFKLAKETNGLTEFFDDAYNWYHIRDYLYLSLTYSIAHLFGSFKVFLFAIEVLIIVPIFLALNNNKKCNNEVIFGMFIFFMFMYNMTYCLARQSIAISFLILGLSNLQNNKKVSAIVCLLVSIGFHITSLLSIIIYVIFILCKMLNKSDKKTKIILLSLLYIISFIILIFFKKIVYFLGGHGIYKHGILFLQTFTQFDFSYMDTALYLFMLYIFIKGKNNESNYDFFMVMGSESVIVLQLGAFIKFMERVSYYSFYPFLVLTIPKAVINNNKINKKRMFLVSFVSIAYWILAFKVLNLFDTVPYILM